MVGSPPTANPVCRFWDWADTLGAHLPTVGARKLISHVLAESANCGFWVWADTLGAHLPTVGARKLISHVLAESANCVHCVGSSSANCGCQEADFSRAGGVSQLWVLGLG